MDSFELNKILGAILGTLLFVMGVGFLAEAIYEPAHGGGPGYELPEPTETEAGPDTGAPKPAVDLGTLLASADPQAGAATAKGKCGSCHDFTEGGPNRTGPNLYDVVGRPIASHPGFNYSSTLAAHSGDTWTYENLNTWLTAPKAFASNTKMSFTGDKNDQERANLIAFLSTLSHSPKPFPAPAAPAGGQAPTGEQTTAGSSSAAPGTAVETPNTTDSTGTNSPGTGTATETPAGASSQPPQTTGASSEAPASSAPASEAASSSAAQ